MEDHMGGPCLTGTINRKKYLFCRNFICRMQYPKYKLTASDEFDVIEFTSISIKGTIDKRIRIEPTSNPLIFNLAFGVR